MTPRKEQKKPSRGRNGCVPAIAAAAGLIVLLAVLYFWYQLSERAP